MARGAGLIACLACCLADLLALRCGQAWGPCGGSPCRPYPPPAGLQRAEAAQARAEALREVAEPLHREGLSLAAIAAALNAQGLTSTGNPMTGGSARALLQWLGLPTGRERLNHSNARD